ncbi:MAG: DUF4388 domain-containing protein [Candidatus Obscuribacterales bacterium]|nr:DUF4388 domain-containing protein [Candidatus Obscuribacterales bacterium]
MFSHKLSSIPNQNYRVDAYPSIDQLKEMIDKACDMSGVKHNYLWEVKKESKKYTLSLHLKADGEDIDWWMYEENMLGTKMVWFHKTKDIAVIYPHILSAVGAKHSIDESEGEEIEATEKPSLGERFRKSHVPENTSVEIDEPEKQREATSVSKLMTGNLRMRPIAWLLQTAAQSDITGELLVLRQDEVVTVQFGLGKPVHAFTKNKVGAEAVLELFTWQDGTASFVEGKQPSAATVQDNLDEIMKQGTSLLEDLGFLRRHSIEDDRAALSRPPIAMTEEQLELRLKDGLDFDMELQRRFYRTVDGRLPLYEVGVMLGLDKSRLIAIAVNLLKLGLVLTPDGRSLRQVAQATSAEAFGNAQGRSVQTGGQKALTPPAGLFGSGSAMDMAKPAAPGTGDLVKKTAELGAPPMPPKGVFGGGDITASSDTTAGARNSVPQAARPGNPSTNSYRSGVPVLPSDGADGLSQTGGHSSLDREFFDVGVPTDLVTFDGTAAQTVYRSLLNKQTGVLTFPALQMFLEREFARAFRFSSEFTLLVFCIRLGSGADATSPPAPVLPMKSVMLATTAISQIKRDVDLFGHFGDKCFGLILPGVNTTQSVALVDRIVADLPKLAPKLGGCWPILHFGVAGVPGDARDVVSLMNAAQKAMVEAADRSYTRILYSEMEQ